MIPTKRSFLRKARDIGYILLRHLFMPMNFIVATVIILLVVFGDTQESLFMGILLGINFVLGTIQEISAWVLLERLETLMVLHVLRLNPDGTESTVTADEVQQDDVLKLKLGDQIPSDGIVVTTRSLAVNESLITGEATSFSKAEGDKVIGGSIVTSGEATIKISDAYADSQMARMTKSISTFSRNTSPIQHAVNVFAEIMGGVLIAFAIFVVVRAYIVHESAIAAVKTIGALATVAFPQGLLLTVTLLFAYGANRLFKKNVILQEINATEKFGRIKNLCMDKTGTLTSTTPTVQCMDVYDETVLSKDAATALSVAYLAGSGDSSQTINALTQFLADSKREVIPVQESLSFSSERQYGAVRIDMGTVSTIVVAGAPDILMPYLKDDKQKIWLKKIIDDYASKGMRIFCIVQAPGIALPESLSGEIFTIVAVFVLENKLREGIQETVKFFQDRGVTLRIISGDNPETVRAVADAAGFKNTDAIITGTELDGWNESDFEAKARQYTIFARIKPEQKEKIIEALKKDGFTAMIGDGANDAMAIKHADLGIAMFDGSVATRHIAAVVLRKNSFADFPDGVRLADRIIENTEIFTSLFFNQTFAGLLFFLLVTITGHDFPFSPLNINFISYFIVLLPAVLIFSWVLASSQKTLEPNAGSFILHILPFPLVSSFLQAGTMIAIWFFSAAYLPSVDPSSLLAVAFIAVGFIFFLFSPGVYGDRPTWVQRLQLAALALIEGGILIGLFYLPKVVGFFDIKPVAGMAILEILPFIATYALLQFLVTIIFFDKRKKANAA